MHELVAVEVGVVEGVAVETMVVVAAALVVEDNIEVEVLY